ncbi:hypothetical protein QQS21_000206 [Conoideocrella luteorostrata]|uniref:Uncharacterized protein n=1 Tax=Conoideocrella luteorostrata TaxID=1105319 RepID=A0AAJ0D1X7_9HYPO|nr:hypothetical protein QQS21_000206 [Conoideocrella luteorostrata]
MAPLDHCLLTATRKGLEKERIRVVNALLNAARNLEDYNYDRELIIAPFRESKSGVSLSCTALGYATFLA